MLPDRQTQEKNKTSKIIAQRLNSHQVPRCLKETVKETMLCDLIAHIARYIEYIESMERRCVTEQFTTRYSSKSSRILLRPTTGETSKMRQLAKQMGLSYGGLLIKQSKFKSQHEEAHHYETLVKFIVEIVKELVQDVDEMRINKQINRLFRTNTFNTKLGYEEIKLDLKDSHRLGTQTVRPGTAKPRLSIDYKRFRREVLTQKSFFKPYVNNRSCFKSTETRSPIISMIIPTKEHLLFNFSVRQSRTHRWI